MESNFELLWQAACGHDAVALRQLVASGVDIDAPNKWGETVFRLVFDEILVFSPPTQPSDRFLLARQLLELGADPNALDDAACTVLLNAIYAVDTDAVRFLLSCGADPNHGWVDPDASIYDAAVDDYFFERMEGCIRGVNTTGSVTLPDEGLDTSDADALLAWLEQEADIHGNEVRPDILRLLRDHGALTTREIARGLGGGEADRAVWREGRWQLDRPIEQR